MRRACSILAAMSATLGTSCDAAPTQPDRVMTITEVIDNIDALNGQRISVTGYLIECMGYDCRLFRSRNDKEQWDRYLAEILRRRQSAVAEPPYLGIGIGVGENFDAQAAPYANSYVVITGRVTNRCRYRGEAACTDRSTDLEPEAIRRGQQPSAGGAGQ